MLAASLIYDIIASDKDMSSTTSKKSKYTKDLGLLFLIPVAIAIMAAIVVYLPQLLANPKYDFIYSACDIYYCHRDDFSVNSSGKIIQITPEDLERSRFNQLSKLHYYDLSTSSSKVLTLEEAQMFTLDTSSRSPDGYILTQETKGGGGFPFWMSDYSQNWYLRSGNKKMAIDIQAVSFYNTGNINFLGWVIE